MNPLDPLHIGRNIRYARNRMGYTQEELGYLVHVSSSHISHIENGTTHASLDTIFRIADALHTSIDALLLEQYEYPALAMEYQILRAYRALSRDQQELVIRFLAILVRNRRVSLRKFLR
ncbi:MAG: helix-turn-helix transcriptional regulator [Mogibacterium sp.]|nr:helix-turn-helix transcriptional regulator [Mogibacterium sp.]